MNAERKRTIVAAVAASALFCAFLPALFALPHFGESRGTHERRRAIEGVRAGHALNLDAFVNFDYRGFDTLGEEFIFLVAVAGFTLILNERRQTKSERLLPPSGGRRPREGEPEVDIVSRAFVAIGLAYGIYIVVHGQLTPGGGFQGGVELATAFLVVALGSGYATFRRVFSKEVIEPVEAIGTLSYAAIGLIGFAMSGVFLRNVFAHGSPGALLSGGTILALNDGVGVAITAGFVVLFAEFFAELTLDEEERT